MRVCPTAYPFFRVFVFLFFLCIFAIFPTSCIGLGNIFFAAKQKLYKIPFKRLTCARVSYIILSLLGLFLLNFTFIFNKLNKGLAKQSKKFTMTKLLH